MREKGRDYNIMVYDKLHLKIIVTFKREWGKLYYTQHFLKQCLNLLHNILVPIEWKMLTLIIKGMDHFNILPKKIRDQIDT